jgi:hypothetical protein
MQLVVIYLQLSSRYLNMNIILDNNSLGIFLNSNAVLTEDGVVFPNGGINIDYTTANASMIDADNPNPPLNNAWQWNGSAWEVYDQAAIDAYNQAIADQQAQANKATATQLLQATDWTTIADVGNPQMSNPYLANQAEFIAYRNQVRQYAVYPQAGNIDWPTIPQENWVQV